MLINTSAINSGDEDASSNTRSQVLSAVKHCVTVVYSSITILSASKSTLKKAGSLPHSMESTLDEDDIKLLKIFILDSAACTMCLSVCRSV